MRCLHWTPSTEAQNSMQKRIYQGFKSQRWWMTPWKQYPLETTGTIHIWTHNDVAAYKRSTTVQARQDPSTEKQMWTQNPTLTQKLFATDAYWKKKKNQLSPIKCLWEYQLHFRAGLVPRGKWPVLNKYHVDVVQLCFVIYCLIGFLFL